MVSGIYNYLINLKSERRDAIINTFFKKSILSIILVLAILATVVYTRGYIIYRENERISHEMKVNLGFGNINAAIDSLTLLNRDLMSLSDEDIIYRLASIDKSLVSAETSFKLLGSHYNISRSNEHRTSLFISDLFSIYSNKINDWQLNLLMNDSANQSEARLDLENKLKLLNIDLNSISNVDLNIFYSSDYNELKKSWSQLVNNMKSKEITVIYINRYKSMFQ